ncbi:hypothetical protein ACLSZ3_05790 [Avibacterium gallinarum]|uniref:hypothetical protein n=1 Tax=Avibacterium gallinarum TaxID=755 RepID=UPI003BF915F4
MGVFYCVLVVVEILLMTQKGAYRRNKGEENRLAFLFGLGKMRLNRGATTARVLFCNNLLVSQAAPLLSFNG